MADVDLDALEQATKQLSKIAPFERCDFGGDFDIAPWNNECADAIVATLNAAPALIAELRRLRGQRTDLRAWLEDQHDTVDRSDGTPGPNDYMRVTTFMDEQDWRRVSHEPKERAVPERMGLSENLIVMSTNSLKGTT